MPTTARRVSKTTVLGLAAASLGATFAVTAPASAGAGNSFAVTPLVSDQPGVAATTDPSLVNAWGMSQGPSTPVWVSDNGTNVTTLYAGASPSGVTKVPLTVSLPGDGPTGQAFNPDGHAFMIGPRGHKVPARFLFVTESGAIDAWSPDLADPTHAENVRNVEGAVYKGLALATVDGHSRLYAADFRHNRIDVRNRFFDRISRRGGFTDASLPKGYAPFGIASLAGKIYVSYAKQDAQRVDDVAGAGHGFVDVYTNTGRLVRRLVSRGKLNSPWGLAVAPGGFGRFGGDLLVGNFGDGRIHAYNRSSGALEGTLRDTNGHAIVIDGLWALLFGNGTSAPTNTLMFSAGPDQEAHGLFGVISD